MTNHQSRDDQSGLTPIARQLSASLGRSFFHGNAVTVLNNGDQIFPEMMKAIDAAEHTIEFQTFVYWRGDIAIEFATRLAAAARRGVTVRVLLDSFGSLTIDKAALKQLQNHCDLCWFRPLKKVRFWQNLKRSHRKLLICDNQVGFTGGVGIAAEWTGTGDRPGSWRDSHFKLEGPVVATLKAAFLEGWLESCGPDEELDDLFVPPPSGTVGNEAVLPVLSTASDYWSSAGTMLLSSVFLAETSLKITTPYFVVDRKLRSLLLAASRRGVDVEIIIPAYRNSDSRLAALAALNCIPPLIENGIRIYTFEPTLIHNKCIIVDDRIAIIGSVNLNQRSQRKDDEFSLIIDRGATVEKLAEEFTADLERSVLLSSRLIKKRHKYFGSAARLIYPIRRQL